jgi:hypothetical protein
MRSLNEAQIKSLITGVKLAAELESSDCNLRCFISLFAYQYNEQGEYVEMTKLLKTVKDEDIFFLLRKYEIPDEFIKNGWYASDDDLVNSIYVEDIRGFKNLENKLLKYMSDLSSLQPEWKCEIPL